MKKRYIITIILIIIACIGYLVYHFTWDTQSIPKGDLLRKINSPRKENHLCTISSKRCKNEMDQ